jgi:hypothetical protein
MAGYLDHYGAGEARREKVFINILIALAVSAAVGLALLYIFYNFRQEHQVNNFLARLAAKDYKGAYALWGCTDSRPCPNYSFESFMRDWGPANGDPAHFKIADSHSCANGVILHVNVGNEQQTLWVERGNLAMSFSPFPGCPNPKALLGGPAPR